MKIIIVLLLSYGMFASGIAQLENDNQGFLRAYEQEIIDDSISYKTKTLYEVNHEARELLNSAKLSKTPYSLLLNAFDMHTKMQNGMFAILSTIEKKEYMKEHKVYIDALFNATTSNSLHIHSTFNRWINYKRTLFDNENKILSNKKMRAKKSLINRKKREIARLYQERPLRRMVIQGLKSDIERFEKSLSSDLAQFSVDSKISFDEVSAVLKPNELYIDFAKIGGLYYLFSLDKHQNIGFMKLDAFSIDYVIKKIQKTREKIIEKEEFAEIEKAQKNYKELYRLIMGRVNLKEKTSLIISPDGLLNLLPFEALYSQKYLVETFDIQYVPSAKELLKLHENSSVSNNKMVLFANPNFNSDRRENKEVRGDIFRLLTPTFCSLKGTLTEAKKIKSIFPLATLFSENMATEANLLNTVSPKILHLATHGFFLENEHILNPMLKSGIVLSGANESIKKLKGNGVITALELSELNLKGTELIVLSACRTGVGKIEEAEGVIGLNKAFMSAGAKQIIMSLWSVSDGATALLMEQFYKNIKRGESYSRALNSAKRWMIMNHKIHPYYWAGFVSSGVNVENLK